jgi:hypothetical protein
VNIVFIYIRGLNDPHMVSRVFLSRVPADSRSVSMNHVQQCEICVLHSDVSKGSVLPRCDRRVIGQVDPDVSKDRGVFIVIFLLWAAWLFKVKKNTFLRNSTKDAASRAGRHKSAPSKFHSNGSRSLKLMLRSAKLCTSI